ncbi:zinc finger domain-containing protein [Streptomyces goshikiensis]
MPSVNSTPSLIPGSVFDAAMDIAYETHRRFRYGAFAEACPTCHAPAGELCLARRSVHAARRRAHRARSEPTAVPPVAALSR